MLPSTLQESSAKKKALLAKFKENVLSIPKSYIKLGKDDPRRITHSLKVALAITLVSFIYYERHLYDRFGVNGIWAVITVVVVFEFTAGATLSKGLNRVLATLLGSALGFGAVSLARRIGHICDTPPAECFHGQNKIAEGIVIGISVFIIAAGATFTRFFPEIKARYDYGVMILILTFTMVTDYGFRLDSVENDFQVALERLETVLIGGATCIIISICIFPVWAGEDLHNSIASNLEKLANYLQAFGSVCFQSSKHGRTVVIKKDEPFLQGYKSVLSSKVKEEMLANFARWEPGHGRFGLFYPWKQYLKIGDLARECASSIEAINPYVDSDIQQSPGFQSKIQESCKKMSAESSMALRELARAIKTMTEPSSASPYLENSKFAMNHLKTALKDFSFESADLLAILPAASVSSILVEIIKCIEKISKGVHELSELARFKNAEPTMSCKKLHQVFINPSCEGDGKLNMGDKTIHFINLLPRPENNKSITN
ncbi:hypothetical protein SLA2020_122140 [Shorea laevis]